MDIRQLKGVDVVADVRHLPFQGRTFDEVVSVNPHGYNPLQGDVARVLKSGGTCKVVAQPTNWEFRQLLKAAPTELRSLGYARAGTGAVPAEGPLRFGKPKTTRGDAIDPSVLRQLTFRRLP